MNKLALDAVYMGTGIQSPNKKMKPSRQFRFFAALFVLFSMLFTQLAVAAYACPNMEIGQGSMTAAMSSDMSATMPGCTGTDLEQPALCHAHDKAENQSLDKPAAPHVESFVPLTMLQEIVAVEASYRTGSQPAAAARLLRSTAPPVSILNCCFRI